MTNVYGRQPAIALVDDDYHSARLMTRMIEAHGGPAVTRFSDSEHALDLLAECGQEVDVLNPCMAVVDIKCSEVATRDFVANLKQRAPKMLVVALSPSFSRETRNDLLEAGAAAVFERHSDIKLYRREAASIVAFWVRSQHLNAVGV